MDFLRDALREYLFLIPIAVLILSEATKWMIDGIRGDWRPRPFHPGGMPSSHSAFVMSMLIVVGRKLQLTSPEFAIAFVFACVTWYDAMSSRRAIGLQAKMLNRLQHWEHFTEQLGHSAKEVLCGMLFGAVVTLVGITLS